MRKVKSTGSEWVSGWLQLSPVITDFSVMLNRTQRHHLTQGSRLGWSGS